MRFPFPLGEITCERVAQVTPPAAIVKGGIGGLCVGDMSSPSVFAQGGASLQL